MAVKMKQISYLFFAIITGIIGEIQCGGSRNYYLDEVCDSLLDMEDKSLESVRMEITRDPAYYNNMDCVVYLRAPQDKQFEVKVLQNYIISSPGCENDFFQIFDGPDINSPILQGMDSKMCGASVLKPDYTSSTRSLTLRFKSDKKEGADGFKILFTAFRTDAEDQCMDSEFQCSESKRCISDSLVCDYNDDCTDASDGCSRSTTTIIAISVGCVAGVILIIAIIAAVCCFRRSRRRDGFKRQLSQATSDDYVTSVDDVDYSELRNSKALSSSLSHISRPTSVYSIKSEPYVIRAPVHTKPGQVWITAPPEVSRLSVYSNPNF